jgi:uncharacterized protein YjbI with pentapeptide repeats
MAAVAGSLHSAQIIDFRDLAQKILATRIEPSNAGVCPRYEITANLRQSTPLLSTRLSEIGSLGALDNPLKNLQDDLKPVVLLFVLLFKTDSLTDAVKREIWPLLQLSDAFELYDSLTSAIYKLENHHLNISLESEAEYIPCSVCLTEKPFDMRTVCLSQHLVCDSCRPNIANNLCPMCKIEMTPMASESFFLSFLPYIGSGSIQAEKPIEWMVDETTVIVISPIDYDAYFKLQKLLPTGFSIHCQQFIKSTITINGNDWTFFYNDTNRCIVVNPPDQRLKLSDPNLSIKEINKLLAYLNCAKVRLVDYVDFTGAKLEGAKLEGINLRGANLAGVNFIEANLRSADLSGANLEGANFDLADLEAVILTDANLGRVDFTRAHLRSANLVGANLTGANLTGANLTGANLSDAIVDQFFLRRVGVYNNAILPNMYFNGAWLNCVCVRW